MSRTMKKLSRAMGISIIGLTSLATIIILLFSNENKAIENDISVVENSVSNRMYIMGNDTELLNDYSLVLLDRYDELQTEQEFIDSVKAVRTREQESNATIRLSAKTVKEPSNRWDITLTKDEIDLLAKIVWVEARGESKKGKIMIVEVIFNRMIHDEFKGDLTDVLSAKNQFCSWRLRGNAEPTKLEYDAIEKVLKGESEELTLDYVYFSTSPRNNRGVIKEKNHYFCKY
jgi:N-acetylmuramoyl-L-alanine amidase